ncbi:MAG: M23 family metallopeptidase [Leptospiraceae bacterium]|nr:M23 family metallopeptidase [Leptospiraceae bacterium]
MAEKKKNQQRKPGPRSGKKKNQDPMSYSQLQDYLRDPGQPPRPPTRWDKWKEDVREFLELVHLKGREKLTIMVIPHNERKIFNAHINLYSLSAGVLAILVVMTISVFSLVGKSGEDIQFYDMGLSNSQFNLQSVRMAEEILPLHGTITSYANTIAELYLKLGGDRTEPYAQGGAGQAIMEEELTKLREAVDECKTLGSDCEQSRTEELLQRVLFLSRQDNENLKRAVELSDRILKELKGREMQNLLSNTPSIWPARGYILSPYGWQTDALRGKQVFRQGIEIGTVPGTEVVSTAPGEVVSVDYDAVFGLHVWVEHRFGMKTFYAHLDRVDVGVGDQVEKGQAIGLSGQTGQAPTNMLYYELHIGTVAYNPHAFMNHLQEQWLNPPNR